MRKTRFFFFDTNEKNKLYQAKYTKSKKDEYLSLKRKL
jgi:hypothetical protein